MSQMNVQWRNLSSRGKVAKLILKYAFRLCPEGVRSYDRRRPYYLQTEGLMTGHLLSVLAEIYVRAICSKFEEIYTDKAYAPRSPKQSQLKFDVLFAGEVRDIPLLGAISSLLFNRRGYNKLIACFRHILPGRHLEGKRVLVINHVIDDWEPMSAAVEYIRSLGGEVVGVVTALDYEERVCEDGLLTVAEEIKRNYDITVVSLFGFEFLMRQFILPPEGLGQDVIYSLAEYRKKYGVSASV